MPNYPNITNANLWDAIRAKFPNFKSHTAKATAELFTESGFEQLQTGTHPDVLNDFFELSLRVYLQQVNISHAEDQLARNGFGEYYDQPLGGYIQRMSIDSVKPVSPAYKGLVNGATVDPFVVRKPTTNERFFKQNFDYQSLLTIPDEFQYKQIFISEYGMSEYMAGLMTALENGYTVQLYNNKLEAINAGINSTNYPLQDTQKVEVAMTSGAPTADQLTEFILSVQNVVSAMILGPQSSGYNALNFASIQEKDRLKLLVRPGLANAIRVKVRTNAYNQENLNIPIDVIEVPNFGGLTPYKESTYTTLLYPVYDNLGTVIGFNEAENQTSVTVQEANVFWKDPNADVLALIADKGYIFFSQQNPYRVEPVRNARGLYTNYWASSPNNAVCVDHLYNVVEVVRVDPT